MRKCLQIEPFASFWKTKQMGNFCGALEDFSSRLCRFLHFLISGSFASESKTSELLWDQPTTCSPQPFRHREGSPTTRIQRSGSTGAGAAGPEAQGSPPRVNPTTSARSHHHSPPPAGAWRTRVGRRAGETVGNAHLPTVCYHLSQEYRWLVRMGLE